MALCLELLVALLAAFGLFGLLWLGWGGLLLPAACPVRAVLSARGDGEGLEQAVNGLLWLRRSGLWRGEIVIEDGGLSERGLALAAALAERRGVRLALGDAGGPAPAAGPGEAITRRRNCTE